MKILPFKLNTIVNYLPDVTDYANILLGHGFDINGCIYNNCISLQNSPQSYNFDFYNTKFLYDLLCHEYITENITDAIQFVISNIDSNKYVNLNLNAKYITNIPIEYEWYHNWRIYGYDDLNKIFYAAGYVLNDAYSALTYQQINIKFDDLCKSLPPLGNSTGYGTAETGLMNNHVCWIPENFTMPKLDMNQIKQQIKLYACNSLPSPYNYYAYSAYITQLKNIPLNDSSFHFELKEFKFLVEQKNILKNLIHTMAPNCISIINDICNYVKLTLYNAIKYNIKKENLRNVITKIENNLLIIQKLELQLMQKLYNNLSY